MNSRTHDPLIVEGIYFFTFLAISTNVWCFPRHFMSIYISFFTAHITSFFNIFSYTFGVLIYISYINSFCFYLTFKNVSCFFVFNSFFSFFLMINRLCVCVCSQNISNVLVSFAFFWVLFCIFFLKNASVEELSSCGLIKYFNS